MDEGGEKPNVGLSIAQSHWNLVELFPAAIPFLIPRTIRRVDCKSTRRAQGNLAEESPFRLETSGGIDSKLKPFRVLEYKWALTFN